MEHTFISIAGRKCIIPGFLLLLLFSTFSSTGQIITTVAGNGTTGYSGDGGPATAAQMQPTVMVVDSIGNWYITDNNPFNVVCKVTSGGIINTIAGNGTGGYSGDGGPATGAMLHYPVGIALDFRGNIYIADNFNDVIRKINPSGIITTIAGVYPYSSGGLPGGYSGDGGPASASELNEPSGLATDRWGNLFIADYANNVIRKIDTSGIITTVAGLYMGATSWGVFGSYSGDGGPAVLAGLWDPTGVAVDTFGNLFIADTHNNVIRKVNQAGIITTVAGNDSAGYSGDSAAATNAKLNGPVSLSVDGIGNLFISDELNNVIRKVDTAGIITTICGTGYGRDSVGGYSAYSGDGGPATLAELHSPIGNAIDSHGNLLIADENNAVVRKVTNVTGYPPLLPSGLRTAAVAVNNVVPNTVIQEYPNPFTQKFTLSGLTKGDKLMLYDANGIPVSPVWEMASSIQTFDTGSITAGDYILYVWDAEWNVKQTIKLVKD